MNAIKKLVYLTVFACVSVIANGEAKYVFFFIGDGMGVNQVNCTEMYRAALQGKIGVEPLLFSQFPVATFATTFSANASVTDSAAGGTALSTGTKTYNGAIGLDENKNKLETIAEMAKKKGMKVGIATSVSIDHATPAAFYAHQPSRNMYHEISLDLPVAGFDFYAGSGFLQPIVTDETTNTTTNIFNVFEQAGYTLARGYDDYKTKAAQSQKIILMQTQDKDQASLPYAIDRKADDLTLTQITECAIDFLTKDNDSGFFVMIEGGKIDWACHSNDIATAFKEVEDLDSAISVAYEFYKKHPDETLIVITADHETGGMIPGLGGDDLNLQALQYQMVSIDQLSVGLDALKDMYKEQITWEDVQGVLSFLMGFWTQVPLTEEQEQILKDEYYKWTISDKDTYEASLYGLSAPLANRAKEIMAQIAIMGWTSGGHSATYVPVFAIGEGSELFGKKIDNTEIPKCIIQAAGY